MELLDILYETIIPIVVTLSGVLIAFYFFRKREIISDIEYLEVEKLSEAAKTQIEASKLKTIETLTERIPSEYDPQDVFSYLDSVRFYPQEIPLPESESPIWPLFESLLNKYHTQALQQSNFQFIISIIAAIIGFLWIILSGLRVNTSNWLTVIQVLPGVVIDSIAYLFFKQTSETRERATALFEKLRSDRLSSQALDVVESINDTQIKSVIKAQLALHMAGLEQNPIDLSVLLGVKSEKDL